MTQTGASVANVTLPFFAGERLRLARKFQAICWFLAVVIHLLVLGAGAWDWLSALFSDTDDTLVDGDVEVPIELDIEASAGEDVSKPNGQDTLPSIDTTEQPSAFTVGDAGLDAPHDAPPDALDAGAPDAAGDAAIPIPPDAPPPLSSVSPSESVKAPKNPSGNVNNVEIVLVGRNLREHPIGIELGAMLPTIKQWDSFFQGSDIDAIKDIDLMVLMGPQVVKSQQVDVIMVFNIDMDRVKTAVSGILSRSKPKGEWLEGTQLPAGIGKVAKGERLFVIVPEKKLLYITPPPKPKKGEEWTEEQTRKKIGEKIAKIAKLKSPTSKVPFAISLSVKEPGKLSKARVPTPFGDKELQLVPPSIEKMVLRATPLPNSEGMVRLEFWDESPEKAAENLREIQGNYGLAQVGASLGLDLELPDTRFAVDGRTIYTEVTMPRATLEAMITWGKQQIKKE